MGNANVREEVRLRRPLALLTASADIRHSGRESSIHRSGRDGGWLGGRDSNPDNVVKSHVSYR